MLAPAPPRRDRYLFFLAQRGLSVLVPNAPEFQDTQRRVLPGMTPGSAVVNNKEITTDVDNTVLPSSSPLSAQGDTASRESQQGGDDNNDNN